MTSKKIELLSEHIIDQIKAGEVIERPSTLLKEIIENSIDAGSTKIDLQIHNNGLDLISIEDNGSGIDSEDLPLAFCRHATSKIERFEDIYRLGSYGFRGEALASIASISKVSCQSTTERTSGFIKIAGGETLVHEQSKNKDKQTGTQLFIKDLFFSTPVRMKFIQSKTSEKNQLKKIINAYLLTTPNVSFSVKWDENEKIFYPPKTPENFSERILDTLFSKNKKNTSFYKNENAYDGVGLEIFLTKQSSRGNAHKQNYIFINERYVQDIAIHKIVLNSAANLWPEGETGSYILKITVPSDEIDVNIHPNKTVVKLFQAPKVYSLVSSSVKQIEAIYSLKEIKKTNTETELNFNFEEKLSKTKDLSYKKIDFTSEAETNHYLENIHNTESTVSTYHQNLTFSFLKKYQSTCLISFSEDIYVLNLGAFFKYDFLRLVSTPYDESEIIPLMVSRPIKLKNKVQQQILQRFSELGFELDQIANDTILLRSFPKKLQHYPYILLLEDILNNSRINSSNLNAIWNFSLINIAQISDYYIRETLATYPLTDLLANKIILKLTEQHLKQL